MQSVMRFWLILVLTLWFSIASGAQGGYPADNDLYINDHADRLTPAAEDALRTALTDLHRQTDIEMVVVTIDSVYDYRLSETEFETFATGLFNAWAIGDVTDNDGILLLVAVEDGDVRLEIGAGFHPRHDETMGTLLDEHVLPHFRADDYQRGIVQGVGAVIYEMTEQWPAVLDNIPAAPAPAVVEQSALSATSVSAAPATSDGGPSFGTLLLILAAVSGVGGYVIISRRCPDCGKYTLSTHSDVVRPATTSSSGTKHVTKHCRHCGYHNEFNATIPRKSSASSSSGSSRSSRDSSSSRSSSDGSSRGGGQSSGGGASRKW